MKLCLDLSKYCDEAHVLQELKEYEQRPAVIARLSKISLPERDAFERGFMEGYKEGYAKGMKMALVSIVKGLKANNVDANLIADVTGMDADEIDICFKSKLPVLQHPSGMNSSNNATTCSTASSPGYGGRKL